MDRFLRRANINRYLDLLSRTNGDSEDTELILQLLNEELAYFGLKIDREILDRKNAALTGIRDQIHALTRESPYKT